ncbi:MAG TPA: hypothetical protein VID50_10380 [Candidatus Eisenbacteria bacterium]|jgi:hypothetical protein
MSARGRGGRRDHLPDLLATILESRGATVTRDGTMWEAALPPDLQQQLGVERVRFAATAGRAARGVETDIAVTERILLVGRSHGQVARLVAPGAGGPDGAAGPWIRFHWRVRFGTDEVPEELHTQTLPLPGRGGGLPPGVVLRAPSEEEEGRLRSPAEDPLARVWSRALRSLESRIRRRLRPHEERERRELHREMRTLSTHYRSLIAEERAGRARRAEDREADRMLELKEDWERKLSAMIRRRQTEVEAALIAVAIIHAVPGPAPARPGAAARGGPGERRGARAV